MHIKIHRGTKEIGGSCVEVWTNSTRIVIDIGMPLVEPDGTEFSFRKYKKLSPTELIAKGILPDIRGFYADADTADKISGLLVSHAHMDHFGLGSYLHPDIVWHMGNATHELIRINSAFTPLKTGIGKTEYFTNGKEFSIGDITITPFLMDHSAFDAYAFLLDAGGKRLFYSGDFRSHGRKGKLFEKLISNPPPDIDGLLLEGTALGREDGTFPSEEDIQKEMQAAFESNNKLSLVWTSGQNIDRLVTVYKAARDAGKCLLVDFYTAAVLTAVSKNHPKIPNPPNFDLVRIYNQDYLYKKLESFDLQLAQTLRKFQIARDTIAADQEKYVMMVRRSTQRYLEGMDSMRDGLLVYSLWEGYLGKPDSKKFTDWLATKGFTIRQIHTSGHADVPTSQSLVKALDPKTITPIHTFHKDQYRKYFGVAVKTLEDKQEFRV